jgi:hypothetical protein
VVNIAGMSGLPASRSGQHCRNVSQTSYQQVVNIAGMILIQQPLSGQYRRNTRLAFAVVSIAGMVVNMVGTGGHDGQDYTINRRRYGNASRVLISATGRIDTAILVFIEGRGYLFFALRKYCCNMALIKWVL